MDELRIMKYEPKHRYCKSLYSIPRRNDFIEVQWCMDHLPGLPEEWCPAEVLHVTSSPEQDCLARGMILYLPGHSSGEQMHKVEFFSNFKLRRAGDLETTVQNMTKMTTQRWSGNVSSDVHNRLEEGDKDWSPINARYLTGDMDTQSREQERTPLGERHSDEITSLRNGHATLAVEVQKLKREIVNLSHPLHDIKKPHVPQKLCTGAGCVLPRLRYKLALKLQATVRTLQRNTGKRFHDNSDLSIALLTGDVIHVGALKARVDCTLQQFECVARRVRETTSLDSVYFFPDFSHTQLPLQCSSAFRILFKTFSDLADQVGVDSKGDKLEMARKCGAGPQGDILRILGTYHFCRTDANMPARIYPGSSCGEKEETQPTVTNEEAVQLFPVLTRTTREWNQVDRRFVHELKSERTPLPRLREQASEVEASALRWKRAPDLGAGTWSRSLTEPAQVFGLLDATLPYIQTQGKYLCTEVGGMASDDVWDELFRKRD